MFSKISSHAWRLSQPSPVLRITLAFRLTYSKILTHTSYWPSSFYIAEYFYIIIIVYLSWSWATSWPVPFSRIQKYLQRSTMIPTASWRVVFIFTSTIYIAQHGVLKVVHGDGETIFLRKVDVHLAHGRHDIPDDSTLTSHHIKNLKVEHFLFQFTQSLFWCYYGLMTRN